MRMYQRQGPPSGWVPGVPAIPIVAGEHGPARILLPQAASGPHRAPQAVGRARPRGGPASDASVAATRLPCAVQAAAGTRIKAPEVPAAAPPAVAAAVAAALSDGIAAALRRPERLRGAASRVVRVMRDQAVRETPPSASQGQGGEC